MKNLSILLAGAALVAFSFTSCKKDYSCDCEYSYEWTDGTTTDYTVSYALLKQKKGDAEEACTKSEDALTAADYTATCTLNKK
jgi:hypothetical protein